MSAPMKNMQDCEFCEIEATVASGFENVVKEDAEEKFNVPVDAKRGRIAFKVPMKDVKKVLDLGGIDNCFVVMSRFSNVNFTEDELECMALLRKIVYNVNWKNGLDAWSKIFSFHHPIASSPETVPVDLGAPTLSSRFHQPKDPAEEKKPKLSKTERRKLRKKQAREKSAAQNVQKAKEGENVEKAEDLQTVSTTETGENNDENLNEKTNNSQNVSEKAVSESNVEKSVQKETLEIEQAPAPKKPKTTNQDPTKPAFRVTCNRNGQGHPFDSMGAASNFGGAVYNYFHWNVSMKQFDIEVILNIEGNEVSVCLALTRESLHRRYITAFGPTALRATHAYNMLRLCKLQPGEIICDPMCGGGSIPLQSAVSWDKCYSLCGDIINNALKRTKENINYVAQTQPISLDVVRWDVTKLPLRTESMDVCITDLPFGIRVGSKMNNWKLYPGALMEMARVTRVEKGRACLLTQDKKCINKALSVTARYWKCRNMVGLNMGGLAACVYVLHRTVEKYNAEDAAQMLSTALEHAKQKEGGSPTKTDTYQ